MQKVNVLLVEDNEADIEITRRVLKNQMVDHDLIVVTDGEEALNYIFRQGEFLDEKDSFPPDLIILDINVPKIDGKEVLRQIRSDKKFNNVRILILSSSRNEQDILETQEIGAVTYIHKSLDDKELIEIIEQFNQYWVDKHQES